MSLDVLTVVELSSLLRVSKSQAYRIGATIPRCTPTGTHPRWRREVVMRWMSRNERAAMEESPRQVDPVVGSGLKRRAVSDMAAWLNGGSP